jgi:integrase
MREGAPLPDLTFPNVEYGKRETPWDMLVLLYRGGAAARPDTVETLISSGALGSPILHRVDLVQRLHDEIRTALSGGGSRASAAEQFRTLRNLFAFADRANRPLTVETVTETFCAWADWLYQRTRLRRMSQNDPERRPLSMSSAYGYGATVGTLLDRVLGRSTCITELTRLKLPSRRKTPAGIRAEKQNLEETLAFGHLLCDICDALPIAAALNRDLRGRLQLKVGENTVVGATSMSGFLNLRLEAELLMFIAQTGMNRSQATNLEMRHFSFVSYLDGYQIKEHKARRGGQVLFEIFSDYRPHFERYLEWRKYFFSNATLLFPFIGYGSRTERRFSGARLQKVCNALDVRYVPPSSLRNTRINWLLRVTANADLTAEIAQHAKQTLLRVYERPSLQRTIVEATKFWSRFDPHMTATQAVAPGACLGAPSPIAGTPETAPKPDCLRASGCLWCENHRDVDSLDYIWALASFAHLKFLELSHARSPQKESHFPPAKIMLDRIHDKLRWFERSSAIRRDWVEEAQARIAEGNFHPDFSDALGELEDM